MSNKHFGSNLEEIYVQQDIIEGVYGLLSMVSFAGLVTTTRITHATPAAAYGHSAHRDWECDSKIPEEERGKGCKDLGRQLVEDEPGKNINVSLK